jgi:hypothetical protein
VIFSISSSERYEKSEAKKSEDILDEEVRIL